MSINIFDEYMKINLQIINSLKEDKEDVILFEKREEIIKNMFSLNLKKSEIKKIYKEKGLESLDKELENALKKKMISVKNDIKKLAAGKEANKGYANINRGVNFFSTKI